MTTTPETFTTVDQNTQREITWQVEVAKEITAPNWTHSLIVRRPAGTTAYQMFIRIDEGEIVHHSGARKAW